MRRARRLTLSLTVVALAACGDDPVSLPARTGAGVETVPHGALEPRLRAVRALRAGAGAVRLRTVRFTVEGDSVVSDLVVADGRARLTIDHRGSSFGVPELTDAPLADVVLARLPGGDGAAVVVDPAAAVLVPGTYVVLGTACDGDGCARREF